MSSTGKKFIAKNGLATVNSILAGTLTDNGIDALQVNGSSRLSDVYIGAVHVINNSGEWVGPRVRASSFEVTVTEEMNKNTFILTYDTTADVRVFINGVRLYPSNFTATNGTSVVLNDNAEVGDKILIEYY